MIGFFVILFTAGPLQEEFGWRGYALPRLAMPDMKMDLPTSGFMIGFLAVAVMVIITRWGVAVPGRI